MTEHLLTTADVAELTSMSTDWVRAHAAELGGIRMGDGPGAPLRFEADRVQDALERRRLSEPNPTRPAHRSRPGASLRASGESIDLLPIPEGRL